MQDVVDYLKDLHRIEIQIDTRSLEEVGIGRNMASESQVVGSSIWLDERFDDFENFPSLRRLGWCVLFTRGEA